jgi:hypothetical protein
MPPGTSSPDPRGPHPGQTLLGDHTRAAGHVAAVWAEGNPWDPWMF